MPVFEVIPLQIAAYQVAQARGIIPGDFRYAPAVTLSETGFSGAESRDPAPGSPAGLV